VREIVLIEDSDADAALVRRALDFLSVANSVRHFQDGAEANSYIEEVSKAAAIALSPISIFFIDLVLPGMSGLQLLEQIGKQPAFEKTLRIVLTNLSDVEIIRRAYSLGAQSFLIKPVQPADLRELIEAFPAHWSFNVQLRNPFTQTNRTPGVPSKK
jgi:CheY-like chemotaxis protein